MDNIIKAYSYSDENKVVSFYVDIDEFEDKCKTCKEKLDHAWNGINNKTDFICVNCYCEKYWLYQNGSEKYILNQGKEE